MNTETLAAGIENPVLLEGSDINQLKALTSKYPYAQIFSILYLKALALQKDIRFEEALQEHAFKITDRMKLYQLIHEQTVSVETNAELEKPEINTEIPVEKNIPDETEIQPEKEELTEGTTITTELNEEILAETEVEKLDPEVEIRFEMEVESIEKSVEISSERETIEVETTEIEIEDEVATHLETDQIEIQDAVELDILSEVVSTVFVDTLEKTIPELTQPLEVEKSTVEFVEEKTIEISNPEKNSFEKTVPRSFTDWLKSGEKTPEKSAEKETSISQSEPEKAIQKPDKNKIENLINQFIKEEPSVSKPKKEFYSPTKKAKESLEESGLIYSETLANIFAVQGNFPKAIAAFEQLMLTNPEKKVYFALRIKELQEKLNT
jgi:tetratricopeptide (TPR) repeat protein